MIILINWILSIKLCITTLHRTNLEGQIPVPQQCTLVNEGLGLKCSLNF